MYSFSKGRYIHHKLLHEELQKLNFEVNTLCQTTRSNQVYSYRWGSGPKKVLIWSQMHGNEPTGTFALWHLMNELSSGKHDELKSQLSIRIIPVLNPDGTEDFIRFNAQGIDLNRDARAQNSIEMQAFFNLIDDFQPSWAFNLHDQRNIFNVSASSKPATIAVLSPSYDESRALNRTRRDVMKLIASMLPDINQRIAGHLSRFTDEFYPRAVGDVLMSKDIACLLLESGAYPKDLLREKAVELNLLILQKALMSIADGSYQSASEKDYLSIPENEQKLVDILLRNASYKGVNCDLAILKQETLKQKNELESTLLVSEIGDLSESWGHLEIDLKGRELKGVFKRNEAPVFEEEALREIVSNG